MCSINTKNKAPSELIWKYRDGNIINYIESIQSKDIGKKSINLFRMSSNSQKKPNNNIL